MHGFLGILAIFRALYELSIAYNIILYNALDVFQETLLRLYREHCTSEQFHSELKSDMNVERLPSGKFAVNAMLLKLAMLSFNILRFIGQTSLAFPDTLPYQTDSKRKRLRKVIDDLIRVAVKIVTHARRTCIRL